MKIEVSKASGVVLDCLVAKAEGKQAAPIKAGGPVHLFREVGYAPTPFQPSTDWSQGGPIIERERIGTWDSADEDHQGEWAAATSNWMSMDVASEEFLESPMPYHGPAPLVAAMRCYVASRLGDEVEVPDELVGVRA